MNWTTAPKGGGILVAKNLGKGGRALQEENISVCLVWGFNPEPATLSQTCLVVHAEEEMFSISNKA